MAAGYRKIPFVRFALGAVVVMIPALLLEQTGEGRWAWAYVGLILLMVAVFYSDGLTQAAAFTSSKLQKG
jgi:hypothetical protein